MLGTPLDGEQRSKLLAILSDESRRSAASVRRSDGNGQELESYKQCQLATQRRIHDRAAQVLDPEQAAHLSEYYAMHTAP